MVDGIKKNYVILPVEKWTDLIDCNHWKKMLKQPFLPSITNQPFSTFL